ncbi:MAG: lysozyme [Casimicrobium sp.]
MTNTRQLFDVIRQIKGEALTQSEVDAVNRALSGEIAIASKGMKASPAGVALIHSFEQLRLRSYPDPGSRDGKPVTNGWGTTRDEDGGPIPLGVEWTAQKADRLFARDLAAFEIGVNTLLQGRPTTQNQFDALVSFAYNVGLDIDNDTLAEGLGDSTLLRKHLAGDYAGAAEQFGKWNKNDGQVMRGLTRRRAAEVAMYSAR